MNDDLGGWSLPTDHDVGKDPSFIAIGKGKSPPTLTPRGSEGRESLPLVGMCMSTTCT